MRHIVYIGAFWVVVIIAIRLAVCFPHSLLARFLFSRVGPTRTHGESESRYLLRWAGAGASWFVQAALLFAAGGVSLLWDPLLFESLEFAVLWVVVVPLIAAGALILAVAALARSAWNARSMKAVLDSVHERQV
jgi:hypothetical protein